MLAYRSDFSPPGHSDRPVLLSSRVIPAPQSLFFSGISSRTLSPACQAAPSLPCSRPICLAFPCRVQDDHLAKVLQVPLQLGHLWVKRQLAGTDPQQACRAPPQSTLATGQMRGAQGTSVLSSSLLEEQWPFARRGKAQPSINPSGLEALGLGTGTKAHLSCPFPLSQSPGEARCPGQVTFSRSVARMLGNKSYPRAGNQCRARKPGLRGAEQMEGEQLSWGREDPPSVCGKCRSHGAHHLR